MSENYSSLVWRRFRKNKMGMLGLLLVSLLAAMITCAPFFSPNDPQARHSGEIYTSPHKVRWIDQEGHFHFRPFIHPVVETLDLDTFLPVYQEDYSVRIPIKFWVRSWEYQLLGIKSNIHLLGLENGEPLFLLGSDNLGRDILSRSIYGGRITMVFALSVVALIVGVGTFLGLMSGFIGGKFDYVCQQMSDLTLAFPAVPLYLALIAVLPKTADSSLVFAILVLILSSLQWAFVSRQVRGQALSMKNADFVRAARSVGTSNVRIVWRHILPNVTSNVLVLSTLLLPNIVLTESFLSFLSVGIKAPMYSWGSMLNAAGQFQTIGSYPWLLAPVGFLLLAILGFNALGDGLRDAVDPYASVKE